MTASKRNLGQKIGLLGGGQLARMIAIACHERGLIPVVLSENSGDPAAQVVQHWIQGSPANPAALRKLLEICSVVTFESEFMDIPEKGEYSFVKAQAQKFFPRLPLMRSIQDRRTQKELLSKYKIPQPKYLVVESEAQLHKALTQMSFPCVLKKARGGYDGYGTFIFKKAEDVQKFLRQNLASGDWSGAFTLEEWVPFQREIAILFVRSKSRNNKKNFCSFPLVESKQSQQRCDYVLGPIQTSKVAAMKALTKKFRRLMDSENYVGVLAVELFETKNELLVNELAPRVHNTGHYSMDALSESQFLIHVRAGLGQDLDSPKLRAPAFVMTNLIGESEEALAFPDGLLGKLHWYGKVQNRRGRKMGHINYLGENALKLLKKALAERKGIQR